MGNLPIAIEPKLARTACGQSWCDANQLENAVINLVVNARDAMPEGGAFSIATAERRLTQTDLADQPDVEPGAYIEIATADTGVGMPPEVLARVFEPFFTTKPIGQGTGLGLSQLQGFVRQSGGFVRLESRPDQGTIARFISRVTTTPARSAQNLETTRARREPSAPERKPSPELSWLSRTRRPCAP